MPEFLEKKLRSQARKEGKKGKAADRYVYGTMNNLGAMHGNKETAKGEQMQEKHDSHLERQRQDMKKFKGVTTTYDHRRPKRQVLTRYKRSAD